MSNSAYIDRFVPGYGYSLLRGFSPSTLLRVHEVVKRDGNQYDFGAKVDPDTPSDEFGDADIDCSGYTRYLLRRCTATEENNFKDGLLIPDGSVNQHEWVRENGFKESTITAPIGGRTSGENGEPENILRIAFLKPGALRPKSPGHVALILNGRTYESHSGAGPDDRLWLPSQRRWMRLCSVYVLWKAH